MRISAFCAAVLTYLVIGHTPPAAAQVDQQLCALSIHKLVDQDFSGSIG
jgi:hypothetical protein